MKQKFSVSGMTCSACSAAVERSVKKLEGTIDVNVNLVNNTMTVEYDEQVIDDNKIIDIVEKTGYGASIYTDSSKASSSTDKSLEKKATSLVEEAEKELKARVIISFVFLLPYFILLWGQ